MPGIPELTSSKGIKGVYAWRVTSKGSPSFSAGCSQKDRRWKSSWNQTGEVRAPGLGATPLGASHSPCGFASRTRASLSPEGKEYHRAKKGIGQLQSLALTVKISNRITRLSRLRKCFRFRCRLTETEALRRDCHMILCWECF